MKNIPSKYPLLTALLFIGCVSILFPRQAGTQRDKSANSWKRVLEPERNPEKLSGIKRVAVFMSGEDPYYVKVLQDALSVELRNMGWDLVSQLEIDTALSRNFKEWWSSLPEEAQNAPEKLDQWILSNSQQEQSLVRGDDYSVAELVKADTYLAGTLLLSRYQHVDSDKNISTSIEKIVIETVSLQIINVERRETVFETVIGYKDGKSVVDVAQDIRGVLEEHKAK